MGRVEKVVTGILKAVSIVLFVLLVFIVSWQVFARQVLNSSPPWTDEGARYLFLVLIFIAAALVFFERGHIAVEVLVRTFPDTVQRWVALLIELSVMFFAAWILVRGGSLLAENAWSQQMTALPFSVGQIYLVMPISGVIIIYSCIQHIINLLRGQAIWLISDEDSTQEA